MWTYYEASCDYIVTRKTGETMILPTAPPLRRLLESLPAIDNPKVANPIQRRRQARRALEVPHRGAPGRHCGCISFKVVIGEPVMRIS